MRNALITERIVVRFLRKPSLRILIVHFGPVRSDRKGISLRARLLHEEQPLEREIV